MLTSRRKRLRGSVGQCFSQRYLKLSLIGRGGFCEVFEAYDKLLNRKVALKIPTGRPSNARRLLQIEAKLSRKASSTSTAKVFDVARTPAGESFLVMELLHGKNLAQQLASEPNRSAQTALSWLRQTSHALADVHRRGIVHCDIKPSNIFIYSASRQAPEVRIVDFGAAIDLGYFKQAPTCSPSGTPAYMSPEQVLGAPVSAASDVWALGVVGYLLLTRSLPFSSKSQAQQFQRILTSPPPRLEPLRPQDSALEQILHRCLSKNPESRFAHAGGLAHALDALALQKDVQDCQQAFSRDCYEDTGPTQVPLLHCGAI